MGRALSCQHLTRQQRSFFLRESPFAGDVYCTIKHCLAKAVVGHGPIGYVD